MNAGDDIRGPGLYVHVPFCARKCTYCYFFSRPDGPDRPRETERYLETLAAELNALPRPFTPASVYLGGGTPTALEPAALGRLLALLRERIDLSRVSEFSCEANPGTLRNGVLDILRAGGVTRLSIGAQSFHPATLNLLGRIHSAADTVQSVHEARSAGFDHVSLDLMFAVPGQSLTHWSSDLSQALALGPEHLSLYALTLEPGTPLAQAVTAGRITSVSDDEAADAYDLARTALQAAGFEHYEISNFARPGCACLHNLLYWSGEDYLGAGPAAHSHWKGRRRANAPSLDAWVGRDGPVPFPCESDECLTPIAKAVETLVFSLRRTRGIQRAEFIQRTGFDLDALRGDTIRTLLDRGLLDLAPPDGIRLAASALFISDSVFRDLL